MQCAKCGTQNRPEARFCKQCGAPLAAGPAAVTLCAQCGAPLRAGAQFCARCGQPVARPPQPSPVGDVPDARVVPLSDHAAWSPASADDAREAPVYAPPAYGAPLAAPAKSHRWLWFVVGIVAVVFLAVAAVMLLRNSFKRGDDAEAPSPEIVTLAIEEMALAVSANPVTVGTPLTVTVTFTNTGDVAVQNLRVYLEEAGEPALHPAGATTVSVSDHVIAPGAGETWTFVLDAVAAGDAELAASVSAERATDPPAPDLWRIGPLAVSVTDGP